MIKIGYEHTEVNGPKIWEIIQVLGYNGNIIVVSVIGEIAYVPTLRSANVVQAYGKINFVCLFFFLFLLL